MKEYIITGKTKKHGYCLVYVCGKSMKHAENVLDRMLNNPTENDIKVMENHTDFRIDEVESEKCWWNDPFLAN